jgi:hypothetical protein
MAVESENSDTNHEKGRIIPCHNPYQKPTGAIDDAWENETELAHPEHNKKIKQIARTGAVLCEYFMSILSLVFVPPPSGNGLL